MGGSGGEKRDTVPLGTDVGFLGPVSYACMHACMYLYIYIYASVSVYVYAHVSVSVHVSVYVYVCKEIYIYIHQQVQIDGPSPALVKLQTPKLMAFGFFAPPKRKHLKLLPQLGS